MPTPASNLVSLPFNLLTATGQVLINILPVILGADQDPDHDSDDEESKGRKMRRKKDAYPLELDSFGLPVIPTINELNLDSKKSLIRSFITSHYSKFNT